MKKTSARTLSTFTLYTLSLLALRRATQSHEKGKNGRKGLALRRATQSHEKGKNGRKGLAVACFRCCTLPREREQSLSTHPSPPCCTSPSGTWCKEWPSSPLLRQEPPPEPSPRVCTPRQPPTPWVSTNGAPGWTFGSGHRCTPSYWAFGSGCRRRLHRTGRSAGICLHHTSDGLAPCRSIGAVRRRGDVPLRTRTAASAPVLPTS